MNAFYLPPPKIPLPVRRFSRSESNIDVSQKLYRRTSVQDDALQLEESNSLPLSVHSEAESQISDVSLNQQCQIFRNEHYGGSLSESIRMRVMARPAIRHIGIDPTEEQRVAGALPSTRSTQEWLRAISEHCSSFVGSEAQDLEIKARKEYSCTGETLFSKHLFSILNLTGS